MSKHENTQTCIHHITHIWRRWSTIKAREKLIRGLTRDVFDSSRGRIPKIPLWNNFFFLLTMCTPHFSCRVFLKARPPTSRILASVREFFSYLRTLRCSSHFYLPQATAHTFTFRKRDKRKQYFSKRDFLLFTRVDTSVCVHSETRLCGCWYE